MNGRDKALQQSAIGTRTVVESIDHLRMTFGFASVRALTPIVETKLRNGEIPLRPLQLSVQPLSTLPVFVIVTIPMTFPLAAEAFSLQVKRHETASLCDEEIWSRVMQIIDELSPNDLLQTLRHIRTVLTETFGDQEDYSNGTYENMNADVSDDEAEENQVENIDNNINGTFHCRACGYLIFTPPEIIHGDTKTTSSAIQCTSYFLREKPTFIPDTAEGDNVDGQGNKIYCPHCTTKLGTWSWVGSRCSCSEWMVPSFQFIQSKLDQKLQLPCVAQAAVSALACTSS